MLPPAVCDFSITRQHFNACFCFCFLGGRSCMVKTLYACAVTPSAPRQGLKVSFTLIYTYILTWASVNTWLLPSCIQLHEMTSLRKATLKTNCFGLYHVSSPASRNIISSHSWKVNLNNDGYAEVDPQMKSSDTFSLEDSDMAENEDFLNYWEPDH